MTAAGSWDLKGTDNHSDGVMQQMRDAMKQTPGLCPVDLPGYVALLIESMTGSTGHAPKGKLWQAETTGTLVDAPTVTITISLIDDPNAQKEEVPAAGASTTTPAPGGGAAIADTTIPQAAGGEAHKTKKKEW